MTRIVLAVLVGLVLGASFGAGCALVLYPKDQPQATWASYPTLVNLNPSGQGAAYLLGVPDTPEFRHWLFLGLIYGGGFGMLAGAVVGVGHPLVQAVKKDRGPIHG